MYRFNGQNLENTLSSGHGPLVAFGRFVVHHELGFHLLPTTLSTDHHANDERKLSVCEQLSTRCYGRMRFHCRDRGPSLLRRKTLWHHAF